MNEMSQKFHKHVKVMTKCHVLMLSKPFCWSKQALRFMLGGKKCLNFNMVYGTINPLLERFAPCEYAAGSVSKTIIFFKEEKDS